MRLGIWQAYMEIVAWMIQAYNSAYKLLCSTLMYITRECLRDRTKEIDEMKGVFRIKVFHELSLVVTIGKQANIPGQGL